MISAARVLLVIDPETNTPNVLSGTKGKSRLVGFQWLNNSRIAFYRQPSRGVDTYSLWAINIDGTKPKQLVAGEVEDGYFTYASITDLMEEDDEHVLISYNQRRPKYRDIHKLNIYTGRTTIVAKDPVIDGQTSLGWAIDQQGIVRGYFAVKGLYYYLYHRNSEDADFELLRKFKFQEPSFFSCCLFI